MKIDARIARAVFSGRTLEDWLWFEGSPTSCARVGCGSWGRRAGSLWCSEHTRELLTLWGRTPEGAAEAVVGWPTVARLLLAQHDELDRLRAKQEAWCSNADARAQEDADTIASLRAEVLRTAMDRSRAAPGWTVEEFGGDGQPTMWSAHRSTFPTGVYEEEAEAVEHTWKHRDAEVERLRAICARVVEWSEDTFHASAHCHMCDQTGDLTDLHDEECPVLQARDALAREDGEG